MDSRTVSAQEAIFRRVDGAGCMFRLQFPDFRATRRSGKCRIPCFLSIFQEERNPRESPPFAKGACNQSLWLCIVPKLFIPAYVDESRTTLFGSGLFP